MDQPKKRDEIDILFDLYKAKAERFKIGLTNYEEFTYPQFTSNCCNEKIIENTDICSQCGEHCDPTDVNDKLKKAVKNEC
jgi:hypothetical protein